MYEPIIRTKRGRDAAAGGDQRNHLVGARGADRYRMHVFEAANLHEIAVGFGKPLGQSMTAIAPPILICAIRNGRFCAKQRGDHCKPGQGEQPKATNQGPKRGVSRLVHDAVLVRFTEHDAPRRTMKSPERGMPTNLSASRRHSQAPPYRSESRCSDGGAAAPAPPKHVHSRPSKPLKKNMNDSTQTLQALRRGELAGARELRLRGLKEFPREIFGLADTLEFLDLGGGELAALPDDLGRLKSLRVLFCSNNRFDRLPPALADCASLSQIGFRRTGLREISGEALPPVVSPVVV